ncbi:MAG: hypothetical protein CSA65_02275 [Proteobacteria bacterium]|nr:MAG: hypothetical protein CSB49_06350 [Pseudomonadota bacterium]PIE19479.1 MAG: hypothetical protein CSA65_02275 [Pseudomonadota bacterium]
MALTLKLQPYRFALRRPLRTARGTIEQREGLWISLGRGHGDAAPLPGFSDEGLLEVHDALAGLGESLPPAFSSSLEGAARAAGAELPAALELLSQEVAAITPLPSAAHGLEQAALDHIARARGGSLAQLLALDGLPSARSSVPLSTLVDGPEAAREAIGRGARCLKLKVGVATVDDDVRRVAALREVAGPTPRLRLDANGAWSREAAAAALDRLAAHDLECVEQPVAIEDLDGLAWLRERAAVPIAADESLRTLADGERLLAIAAVDCFVIKPQLCGGLLAARRLARLADEAGVVVAISCSLESQLGCLGALALAAACPASLWPCGLFPALLPESELPQQLRDPASSLGAMPIVAAPGLDWLPPVSSPSQRS